MSRISAFLRLLGSSRGKGSLYRKSLVFVLAVTCIPTLLIGVGSYYIGSSYIEREVHRTHLLQLGKGKERIGETFSQLEINLTQWSLNPSFDIKLKNLDFVNQYAEIQDMYKSILSMKVSNPLIDKIYLYLDGPQALITDELTVRNMSEAEKKDFRSLIEQSRDMYWLHPDTQRSLRQGNGTTLLIHSLAGQAIKPYGALIVYLKTEQANRLLGEMTSDELGTSFLLGEDRQLVGGSSGWDAMQTALWTEMKRRLPGDGSFDWSWDGRTYSVSYASLPRLGQPWTFVSATSLSNLTAPVLLISRLMIGISVFSLLLALLLSWIASNRLYHPIRRMVQLAGATAPEKAGTEARDELELIEQRWRHITLEREGLQQRLDRVKPALKEGFLLQLVQGHLQALSEEETFEQMKTFGWRPEGCGYQLLLLQLRGVPALLKQGRFSPGDEQLITFAAANITEEVARQKYEDYGVINFRDLSVGVLLPLEAAGELQHRRDMNQLAQDLVNALGEVLKLQVTVSIAKWAPDIGSIAAAFEQAKQALSYRRIDHDHEILAAWELLPLGEEPVFYPFELEKTIIQTIRVARLEEAAALIGTFFEELQRHTAKEGPVQQGMQQLLGAILHLVMQTGFHPNKLYDEANMYDQLARLKEPGDIPPWFRHKLVAPYIQALTEAQDFYLKRLIAQVTETIHEQYMNDNISLEYCADLYGTSTVKLSTGFKEMMGINFIDYLTQVRIDKVKELLLQTDMKINDIALAVGYQPTYFNRIFKKQEGMTASEFRERSR